jgi:hypothetical protein
MNKLYPLILLTILAFSCKKQVTDNNIIGTYKLDDIKEIKAFSRPSVDNEYIGATFVFDANENVQCYTTTDTLYGLYRLDRKRVRVRNGETGYERRSTNTLEFSLANKTRTKFITWELIDLQYRNNRSELRGEQDRNPRNYRFEFNRQ